MRIAIEGSGSGSLELAARLCLTGHDLLLSAASGDSAAKLAGAVEQLELPLARLSDHPLPHRGTISFTQDRKSAPDAADLMVEWDADHVTVRGPSGPASLHLPKAAWLPFCHLPEAEPEVEAALTAAGFLLSTPGDLQSLDTLVVAVDDLPQAERAQALSALLRALRDQGLGVGARLLARDKARAAAPEETPEGLVRLKVLPSWIDYNGHMTESRYLAVCSEVTDAVLRRAGFDLSYVAGGYSYYTVETQLRHLRESKLGQEILGETRVLGVDARRLHLLTTLRVGGEEVATLEQMLVHVDMAAGRACAAPEELLKPLRALAQACTRPEGADWLGRGIRSIGPRSVG